MENNKSIFSQLNQMDVSSKIQKKGNLSYLSWAYAWAELKKACPDANYKVFENELGLPYFTSKSGYICKVSVTAYDVEHVMWLPVMDNRNRAIPQGNADMCHINKTIMRALVKAIAMHGLGLYIYAGEDLPEEHIEPVVSVPITSIEVESLRKLIVETSTNEESVCRAYEIKSLKEFPKDKLQSIVTNLKGRLK